jgi:hypothetical protein
MLSTAAAFRGHHKLLALLLIGGTGKENNNVHMHRSVASASLPGLMKVAVYLQQMILQSNKRTQMGISATLIHESPTARWRQTTNSKPPYQKLQAAYVTAGVIGFLIAGTTDC